MELQSVWGWQPALYLFLGGMGAGAFIMAAILYLKDRERNARIVCVSMWAAAISLIVGLLLLLMELVTPVRGLLMWQSFSHFTSWMTYGAWGAFGAMLLREDAGGYVLVAVVSFAAAVVITALCFRLRNRENQKKSGADKPNRHEQEEKSQ